MSEQLTDAELEQALADACTCNATATERRLASFAWRVVPEVRRLRLLEREVWIVQQADLLWQEAIEDYEPASWAVMPIWWRDLVYRLLAFVEGKHE